MDTGEETNRNTKNREHKTSNLEKKIVYNNSNQIFNQREIDLRSLGLNFGITPKKFPLIEYIAATEKLCQSLEEIGDPASMASAQGIRNLVSGELRKGYDMKIKSNLSKEEREILKQIGDDETIIICPADKGKAIVIEDRETYIQKMYQQIDEGDYTKATKSEQTLLDNIHQKRRAIEINGTHRLETEKTIFSHITCNGKYLSFN